MALKQKSKNVAHVYRYQALITTVFSLSPSTLHAPQSDVYAHSKNEYNYVYVADNRQSLFLPPNYSAWSPLQLVYDVLVK